LAVVPVGLTRWRTDLPSVRRIDRRYARSQVNYLRQRGKRIRAELGCEFLYVADEFFVLAGLPFPRAPYYDDFSQVENGIGMARLMLDHVQREQARLPERLEEPLTLWWVTGVSAATFLIDRVIDPLRTVGNLSIEPVVVTNRFYGDTVTVSGLLTGADIRDALLERGVRDGAVLLPPNCLNDEGLFLDDLSPADLEAALGVRVLPTPYEFMPRLRSWLLSPRQLHRVA
jgi:NifB/MoaA-like Fe-S oxidoreductase